MSGDLYSLHSLWLIYITIRIIAVLTIRLTNEETVDDFIVSLWIQWIADRVEFNRMRCAIQDFMWAEVVSCDEKLFSHGKHNKHS